MWRLMCATLFLLAGLRGGFAQQVETVTYPAAKARDAAITAYLMRPNGSGPFPAVVGLHGCGGLFGKNGQIKARHMDWGERFVKAGYAVLFPDSYGSRRLPSQCGIRERRLTARDRVADVQGAAEWLARQPYVDRRRLALMGWSAGGSTVIWATAPQAAPSGADFRVAFAFYPGCRGFLRSPWRPRLPLSILIGESDDWTPAEPCAALSSRWDSVYLSFPGAYHGFDAPNMRFQTRTGVARSLRGDGVVHMGTDIKARASAITYVMETLAREFARASEPSEGR
jgi:dienelactone hydrolase